MLTKINEFVLKLLYRYHKHRELHYSEYAYRLFTCGYTDKDYRGCMKHEYHKEWCNKIDKLLYAIEGS